MTGALPSSVHWHSPWALALLAIPLVLLVWRPGRRRIATVPLPAPAGLLNTLPKTMRQRLLWMPRVLKLLAASFLIVAIARPQIGQGRTVTSTDAIAIQLVIDRSGSMGAEISHKGTTVTRLDAVKAVLKDFVLGNGDDLAGRPHDLIGVVSFTRYAETNCPLVRDPETVVELVQSLQRASDQSVGGTAIGEGLALAAARLRAVEQEHLSRLSGKNDQDTQIKSKVIVLLTDGANNAGDVSPEEAAELAKQWGIKVYCIGIAGGGFTTMNTPFGVRRVQIASDIDTRQLSAIAETTGGFYRSADDSDSLRKVYAEISKLETTRVQTAEFTDYTEMFVYPASAAGAVLIAGSLAALWLGRAPA